MTQNERLLDHFKQGKTIQPMQAWHNLGIYRLGSRIHDLRKAGHNINRNWVTVYNRWGEECRVAEYTLEMPGVAQAHT